MDRRHWFRSTAASLLAAGLSGLLRPTTALAQGVDGRVSLRDRLKAGLLCRRPEEFAFADHVVDLVDQKKISEELVLSTLKWAVEQRPNFPFYYFRDALRLRAKQIGVTI
jgi:hypothetical protein